MYSHTCMPITYLHVISWGLNQGFRLLLGILRDYLARSNPVCVPSEAEIKS